MNFIKITGSDEWDQNSGTVVGSFIIPCSIYYATRSL